MIFAPINDARSCLLLYYGEKHTNDIYEFRWLGYGVGVSTYLSVSMKIIIAYIDVSGTGGQSNEYMFGVYRNLGTIVSKDIINVTQFLSKKYNCIDDQNVGLYGDNYGGFQTALTLENDPNFVFSCGIAGISKNLYLKNGMIHRPSIIFFLFYQKSLITL